MTHRVKTWSHGAAASLAILFFATASTAASGGLRTARVHSITELADKSSIGARIFLRRELNPHWQLEFNTGYSQLSGRQYTTNAISSESRLYYFANSVSTWTTGLYGGIGILGYRLATSPPQRTPGAKATGWSPIVPMGIHLSRPLGPSFSLELLAGYTYTLSDETNRAALEKGNDTFWSLEIGLIFGGKRGSHTLVGIPQNPTQTTQNAAPTQAPNSVAPEMASEDSDGDGLSDDQEKLVYFTNPVMADSDGDGLNDREEIEIYGTHPNRLDSDNGGLRDGDEILRGSNPLDPGDDFLPQQILEEDPEPVAELVYELPVIYFPVGNLTLVAEARENLNRAATYMRMRPQTHIELRGHSDSMGSRAVNLQLARRRAEAVKAYLVEKGIEAERLRVRTYGESKPVASNATQEGRLQNRRVELVPIR